MFHVDVIEGPFFLEFSKLDGDNIVQIHDSV
jgi:hypothetical protein